MESKHGKQYCVAFADQFLNRSVGNFGLLRHSLFLFYPKMISYSLGLAVFGRTEAANAAAPAAPAKLNHSWCVAIGPLAFPSLSSRRVATRPHNLPIVSQKNLATSLLSSIISALSEVSLFENAIPRKAANLATTNRDRTTRDYTSGTFSHTET